MRGGRGVEVQGEVRVRGGGREARLEVVEELRRARGFAGRGVARDDDELEGVSRGGREGGGDGRAWWARAGGGRERAVG